MGEDKGQMLLNGKPMIQYLIETLQYVFNEIKIISNNPEYKKFGLEVISDEVKEIGPLGGIYTALKSSKVEQNFIISCDTPFIESETINHLLEIHKHDVSLVIQNQKLEPLIAVYSKSILPILEKQIDLKDYKLMNLIDKVHSNFVDVNSVSEKQFFNFNSKEDLEKWKLG